MKAPTMLEGKDAKQSGSVTAKGLTFSYAKIGNTAMVSISGSLNSSWAKDASIVTIPFKPIVFFSVFDVNANNARYNMNTSGVITTSNALASGAAPRATFVYATED